MNDILSELNGKEYTDGIYEKYDIGWYSDEACTESIEFITIPTKKGYTFAGYKSGDTNVVDTSGNITSQPTTLSAYTLTLLFLILVVPQIFLF